MEGNLVIVESPAKARTIQKFLGEGFTVKPSFGHIRDLQEKQLGIDIKDGFRPEYVVPEDKKRVVAELSRLASKASTVWLASDEDREGEAISWHLVDTLGLDSSRTRRIAFHEITKEAIQHAIQNPRELDMNLVNAQQARRVLDRLVGFELSPILWKKINKGLSAGRVQSVALRLIVDREREIMAFRPEPFYRTEANFTRADGSMFHGLLDTRFGSIDEARRYLEDISGAAFSILQVEKSEGTRIPSAPFTTSTLQQEASRKLHMNVSQTMRVAQVLYEKGLITYMRTDSTNLSSLALGTAKKYIIENFGAEYSSPRQFKTRTKGAQEAHEAIRPTFIEHAEISGTAQEKALYNLIWKRTVASQMAEARVLNTKVAVGTSVRSEKFTAEGIEVLFDGFLKLYSEGRDDEGEETAGITPGISKGENCSLSEAFAVCKYTRAPLRYTEATLVKKMEELEIGRPSTYAPTISTLTTARGYVLRGDHEGTPVKVTNLRLRGGKISSSQKTEMVGEDKGKLLPQDVGMMVCDYLVANFPKIMDYNYTASVEDHLDRIAEGTQDWKEYLGEIYPPFHEEVETRMHDGMYNRVERLLGTDPADGLEVYAKYGQYGAYVQKGEGEHRQYASLGRHQLIETITLEDALRLLALPRTVGTIDGVDVVANKGRFGPFFRYGDRNFSLPKGTDPLKVSLEECAAIISSTGAAAPENNILREFGDSGISIINGRYGPYIKYDGKNYRIPRGTDASALTEEACRALIAAGASGAPAGKFHRYRKNK